jgi:ribosome modulation factor
MNQMITQRLVPVSRARDWPAHPHNGAHLDGFAAGLAGASGSDNPHAGPRFDLHRRRAWNAGWLEARRIGFA